MGKLWLLNLLFNATLHVLIIFDRLIEARSVYNTAFHRVFASVSERDSAVRRYNHQIQHNSSCVGNFFLTLIDRLTG